MENSIDHIITRILSGNSSSEDFLSLSEWLNADEKNKKEFRLLKSYWDAEVSFSHSLMPNVSLDNLRKKIDDQSRQKRLRLIRFIATPIAAAIAFLVLFFATTHLNTREGKVQQFYTYITDKNKSHFTLDDGTKIILNRNSRFTYSDAYGTDQRKVNLEGEAYFEVAKNKEKRFIVCCNDLEIEALGTTFDVKGYRDDHSVTTLLAEGSVRVSNKTDATLLKPGEKVEYHKNKQTFTKSAISDMREIDFWRNNMLIFNSSSLAEIATTLERMYGVKVVFDSEKLKNVLFSGTIRNSSLHNVFYIISLTYPLTYELEGDTVRIGSSIN